MYALKLYGPRTGKQNSYGAVRAPWVDMRFLFKTAREQPGKKPIRVPGVWCDWGIKETSKVSFLFSTTTAHLRLKKTWIITYIYRPLLQYI